MSNHVARDLHVTSRLAAFTSVKALTAATGHDPDDWALVTMKELADNGIDECEARGIAPRSPSQSLPTASPSRTTAGALPPDVARMLDYNTRVSSTEPYVSPTRGRQSNALQTIFPIPYALDGERGVTTIESCGVKHTINEARDR